MTAVATHSRRLILHMGAQKTGSTSLQQFLQRNQKGLADLMQLLLPQRETAARYMGRQAALFSLNQDRETDFVDSIKAFRDDVDQGIQPVALITHENLPGAMPGRAGTVAFYPVLEKILSLLDRYLAPYVPEFVLYTREMHRWKKSVHNQAIRSDNYTRTYDEFLGETSNVANWKSLQSRMEKSAPGRVHFFRIEDETDRSRPGQQLLKFAGLSDADIAAMKPVDTAHNESLSPNAMEFMRHINMLDLPPKQRTGVLKTLLAQQHLFASQKD